MSLRVFILSLLLCVLHSQNVRGLIVPEEVASGLSYSYGFIPKIKKGIDSRFGVGWRFGKHADFQLQLELGPQFETRPLGVLTKKRQATNSKNQLDRLRMFQQSGLEKFPEKPQMKPNVVNQLQQLYKMAGESTEATPTTTEMFN
ncbi:uncharacterized protein LOC117563616 [Drosophila albomicans]|uniref:Uncharacterized protein LOC117563616 n=1 Tax=Drosophila albomicans TaxID=7291 RepID=A0A6P8WF50_DROAB|nr:uncharacterized protein LOC117563616 [Drosophila albomicans]